jgi:hypothetical protein
MLITFMLVEWNVTQYAKTPLLVKRLETRPMREDTVLLGETLYTVMDCTIDVAADQLIVYLEKHV